MVQHAEALNQKVRPLGNRVFAQRFEVSEALKGGILLPDAVKKKQETVRILAVGPGERDSHGNLVKPSVKEGDVVLIEPYAANEVTLDGEDYLIVRVEDIVAIIE